MKMTKRPILFAASAVLSIAATFAGGVAIYQTSGMMFVTAWFSFLAGLIGLLAFGKEGA